MIFLDRKDCTMNRLFYSDVQFVISSGFLYVPFLLDPTVDSELHQEADQLPGSKANMDGDSRMLIRVEGQLFIKSVSLGSLLDNSAYLEPRSYHGHREALFSRHPILVDMEHPWVDNKLFTIVFEIMPYFVGRTKKVKKRRCSAEAVLVRIERALASRGLMVAERETYAGDEKLKALLETMEKEMPELSPLREGLVSSEQLRVWFSEAIRVKVHREQTKRLKEIISRYRQVDDKKRRAFDMLSGIAHLDSLEIDGFGFIKGKHPGEYFIYKRTGEFALKDYYGRIYLFPDCRVGVSSMGPLEPVVLDRYKHPFLLGHAPAQKICMRGREVSSVFSAKNVIRVIEEGINSLLHGYDYRRRNGYHSLDGVSMRGGNITFEEYMVPKDHPKIVSGKVRVTNEFR